MLLITTLVNQMNKALDILREAATDYSVEQGDSEARSAWKLRIIYTILGKMALASLWDSPEEGDVSIIHFKNRIITLCEAYNQLFPELYFGFTGEELADEIYSIFLNTGVLYHQPNRIVMSTPRSSCCLGITFTRGKSLSTKQKFSGLGSFVDEAEDADITLLDMFQIDSMPLIETWTRIITETEWNPASFDTPVEYHRMSFPFKGSYWVDSPDTTGKVSILRTGMNGLKLYYLYKYDNEVLLVSQLPNWCVENSEYRTLSNACLAYYGILPPIEYIPDGNIVFLNFGYLPPIAEYNFIKLYSWPVGALPSNFKRVCSSEVFDVFKSIMISKGFEFKETIT